MGSVKPKQPMYSPVAMDIAPRRATIYPKEFASAVEGRAKRALGDAFGLSQFGVNLTTLEPGAASSHRHWHQVEDEFIHVVEGTITLVDNAGKHKLTPELLRRWIEFASVSGVISSDVPPLPYS